MVKGAVGVFISVIERPPGTAAVLGGETSHGALSVHTPRHRLHGRAGGRVVEIAEHEHGQPRPFPLCLVQIASQGICLAPPEAVGGRLVVGNLRFQVYSHNAEKASVFRLHSHVKYTSQHTAIALSIQGIVRLRVIPRQGQARQNSQCAFLPGALQHETFLVREPALLRSDGQIIQSFRSSHFDETHHVRLSRGDQIRHSLFFFS